MFHANKGYKLEIVVLISTSPFAKQAFSGDTLFKRYFHENKALHTQNESLQHRLSNEMRQMATFSVFKVQFFQRVFFFIFYFLFLFFFGAGGGRRAIRFFLRSRVRIWVRFLRRYRLSGLSGFGLLYCFSEFR